MSLAAYIRLSKPGIILGNCITTAGGFALATRGDFRWSVFLLMLCGIIGIIASACALNNYIDRHADAQMSRTCRRPLPAASFPPVHALYFAVIAFVLGCIFLFLFTPFLAWFCALLGFFVYVCLYSFVKYHSPYSTHLGSIAGAMPPLVGYFTASPHIDLTACLLFAMMALWQMPHFFAIALFRQKEYAAAMIPVWSVKKGVEATKWQMLIYVAAFFLVSLLLFYSHYTGSIYFWFSVATGVVWLALCLQGFMRTDHILWARRMFFFSLIAITGLCLILGIS